MIEFQDILKEIKDMRREFEEVKLLQLKIIECILPEVKPTQRELELIKEIKKMKFYNLDDVKKKLDL